MRMVACANQALALYFILNIPEVYNCKVPLSNAHRNHPKLPLLDESQCHCLVKNLPACVINAIVIDKYRSLANQNLENGAIPRQPWADFFFN